MRAISRGTSHQPARYIVRNPQGQVMYDVRSSTVVYDRAADGTAVATFTTPHVTFEAPDNRVVIADSPKAVAHDKDKSVVMTGGVHAKTSDNRVLTCTTLTYDELHAQILCVGNVVLTDTKTNQTATGETLQTDPGFEHVTLSGSR
ncbi:MAG: LPS export ABC transporter periplasmic protein LptC [Vulcanimicrobiaceae bacterium]